MANISFERRQKTQKTRIGSDIKRAIKDLSTYESVILEGLSYQEVRLIVKKYHRRFRCYLQDKPVFWWKDSIIGKHGTYDFEWTDDYAKSENGVYYVLEEDSKKNRWCVALPSFHHENYRLKLTRKSFSEKLFCTKLPRKLFPTHEQQHSSIW